MGYEVRLKEAARVRVACKRGSGKYAEEVPRTIRGLFGGLGEAGLKCEGAPAFVCEGAGSSEGAFEVCVPVSGKAKGKGFELRWLEGGRVAFVVHKGAYSKVGEAYAALDAYVKQHGFQPAGPSREFYLNSPDEVPEGELLTEVQFPVK